MLGFKSLLHSPIPSISPPLSLLSQAHPPLSSFPFKTQTKFPKTQSRFLLFAQNNNNNNNNNLTPEPKEQEQQNGSTNNGGVSDDLRKDGRSLFNINWVDLLLDPDPDNILAIGLTGLLTWASVQVLWQLFFVSLAILVAALKYSFIAALLIFILITLL